MPSDPEPVIHDSRAPNQVIEATTRNDTADDDFTSTTSADRASVKQAHRLSSTNSQEPAKKPRLQGGLPKEVWQSQLKEITHILISGIERLPGKHREAALGCPTFLGRWLRSAGLDPKTCWGLDDDEDLVQFLSKKDVIPGFYHIQKRFMTWEPRPPNDSRATTTGAQKPLKEIAVERRRRNPFFVQRESDEGDTGRKLDKFNTKDHFCARDDDGRAVCGSVPVYYEFSRRQTGCIQQLLRWVCRHVEPAGAAYPGGLEGDGETIVLGAKMDDKKGGFTPAPFKSAIQRRNGEVRESLGNVVFPVAEDMEYFGGKWTQQVLWGMLRTTMDALPRGITVDHWRFLADLALFNQSKGADYEDGLCAIAVHGMSGFLDLATESTSYVIGLVLCGAVNEYVPNEIVEKKMRRLNHDRGDRNQDRDRDRESSVTSGNDTPSSRDTKRRMSDVNINTKQKNGNSDVGGERENGRDGGEEEGQACSGSDESDDYFDWLSNMEWPDWNVKLEYEKWQLEKGKIHSKVRGSFLYFRAGERLNVNIRQEDMLLLFSFPLQNVDLFRHARARCFDAL